MQRSEVTISRDDMSSIFNVAMLLRKSILKSKKWEFEGAFDDISWDNIPEEWKRLFH